jgi:hypothetical protein
MRHLALLLTLSVLPTSLAVAAPITIAFTDLLDVPGVTGELDGSEFQDEGLVFHSLGAFDVLNVGCGTGHTCLGAGDFDDPADFSGSIVGNFSIPGTVTPAAVRTLDIDFVDGRATTTLIGLSGILATFVDTDVSWFGAPVYEFRVEFHDDGMSSVTFDRLVEVPEPPVAILIAASVAFALTRSRRLFSRHDGR